MRRELLDILSDPNFGAGRFRVFAYELKRKVQTVARVDHEETIRGDDIKIGFVLNEDNGYVYPISEYVLSMLSDEDVDSELYLRLLEDALRYCPKLYSKSINDNIRRLSTLKSETASGKWNRQEMQYYDSEVDTETKRKEFASIIAVKPLWHIFVEREKYGISKLELGSSLDRRILEIGCGNARTVAWIFHPLSYNYSYVGTDISLRRLVLAKSVIATGDFVQCSAFNLPFKEEVFCATVSFGVLHHLPDPLRAIACCVSKTKSEGCFLLHEPIAKPARILERGWLRRLRGVFLTYPHSMHDSVIDWNGVLRYFSKNGLRIVNSIYSVCVPRSAMAFVLAKLPFLGNRKIVWQCVIAADRAFIRLFCQRPNILGPGAVIAIVRKPTRRN